MALSSKQKLGSLVSFLGCALIAFSIAIIAIIAQELWPNSGYYTVCSSTGACGTVYWPGVCLLTNNSVNVCRYGYSAAAIGIFTAFLHVFAPCMPGVVTILSGLFNSVWWLAFAITSTVYSGIVDDDTSVPVWPDGYPRGNYRVMVYALAWTAFACSLLTIPLGLAMSKQENQEEQDSYQKAQQQVQMPAQYGEGVKGDAQAVPASNAAPGYPPV